jgi:hypothetical protein
MINNCLVNEDIDSLLNLINHNTNTYDFAKEYANNDGGLDADMIIADYKEYADDYWNPVDYLHNILVQCFGYNYDKASKLLCC